jgi:hypothetical protein
MKELIAFLICFTIYFNAIGQESEPYSKHRIFAGYWDDNWPVQLTLFEIGYQYINSNDNLLGVNFLKDANKEYILTFDYTISITSRSMKFQPYVALELKGFYQKQHWYNEDYNIYGPFIGIGFIPTYTFFKRFDLGVGVHVAYGYIWSDVKTFDLPYYPYQQNCYVCGGTLMGYADLRLGYKF